MKKIIMLVGGALLLVGASVGGTLFFTGAFRPKPAEAGEAGKSEDVKKPAVTHYFEFTPEFVVNFSGKSRARFFMSEVSVSTEDEKALEVFEKHNPEIRNDLLMLFGNQDGMMISTAEGKTKLREQTLETIQKIVEKHYGTPAVKDVFFTRFVIQ
ncbi:MAG: flagellar basal body-associated FliL family protein [Gammaproteobacteria bacterium]|nr:flagellar basal body-associated FliL family protein [Gammaproteobacteria bacterium]